MRATFPKQIMRLLLAGILWSASDLTAVAATTNAPGAKATAKATAATTKAPAPAAATNTAPVEVPIPKSVFVVPRTKGDGIDPFFPHSMRLDLVAPTSSTNKAPVVGELVIKGFSGTEAQPLVIINDRTFGVGDDNDVVSPQGRVRVHCLEILLKEETTILEVNGVRRELRFRKGK